MNKISVGINKKPKWSSEAMENTLDDIRTTFELIKIEEQDDATVKGIDPGLPIVQKKMYSRLKELISPSDVKHFNENFYSITQRRDDILQRTGNDITNIIMKDWCQNSNLSPRYFIKTIARDKTLKTINGKLTYDVQERIVPIDEKNGTEYFTENQIDEEINKNPQKYLPEFRRPNNRIAELDEVELVSISNLTRFGNKSNKQLIELYKRIKNSEREKAKAVDWATGMRGWEDYPFDDLGLIGVFPDDKIGKLAPGEILYKFLDFIYDGKMSRNKDRIIKNHMTLTEYISNRDELLLKLTHKYNIENYYKIMEIINRSDRELSEFKRNHDMNNLNEQETKYLRKLKGANLQGLQFKGFIDGERAEVWSMNERMFKAYTGEHIGHTGDYIFGRDEFRELYLHNPALSDGRKKFHEDEEYPYEPSLAIVVKLAERELFDYMFTITSLMRGKYKSE